jgi:hypothetical protein
MKLQNFAHWAEITASLAVVVSLVFLIQEVRGNTQALERQAALDRAAALNSPFFEATQLASVLAKIKAIDGADPVPDALAERYGLTAEEAILWERHLWLTWSNLEADYAVSGESEELSRILRLLLNHPDQQVYWEFAAADSDPGFRAFVNGLSEGT